VGFAAHTVWSDAFSDDNGFAAKAHYESIRFLDMNADGKTDVCGRNATAIRCALSDGNSFQAATSWTTEYSDAADWGTAPSYYETIQYPDVNGDGLPDVCGRGEAGIFCGLSDGSTFGTIGLWTAEYGDAGDWNTSKSYWSTIQFGDVDGDGDDDICGRGAGGMQCSLSTQAAFDASTMWSNFFSDAASWLEREELYATIRIVDLNKDGLDDICGRGIDGIWCQLSDGTDFGNTVERKATLWTTFFGDAADWDTDPSLWKTIRYVDINNDNMTEVCGRGIAGVYCQTSTGTTFSDAVHMSDTFGDAKGFNKEEMNWSSIRFLDLNGDYLSDVCGRKSSGLLCEVSAASKSEEGQPAALARGYLLWNATFSDSEFADRPYWYTINRHVSVP
jgi:hypothetical protein